LLFSNNDHKFSFAAPELEKLHLKIKTLQKDSHDVTKTGDAVSRFGSCTFVVE